LQAFDPSAASLSARSKAGQLVVNADTGEIVKLTPSINPDFAAVVCPALGGQPAG
jgi:hypothetical protein